MKKAISLFTALVLILSPCSQICAEEGSWDAGDWGESDTGWDEGYTDWGESDTGWDEGYTDWGESDTGWDEGYTDWGDSDTSAPDDSASEDTGGEIWGGSDHNWGSDDSSSGSIWSDDAYYDWYEDQISSNFSDQMSEYFPEGQEEEVVIPEGFGITPVLSPDDPESLRGSRDLTSALIRLAADQVLYKEGDSTQTPEVIITWQGETLVPGIDYELYYEPKEGPGTAVVTAIGLGLYAGELPLRYPIRLPSPTHLMVSSHADGQVSLRWNAVSGADGYRLYRRTSGSSWQVLDFFVSETSYTDICSEPAEYRVRAVKGAVVSSALLAEKQNAFSRKICRDCTASSDKRSLSDYILLPCTVKKPAEAVLESAQCREQTKVNLFWEQAEGAKEYIVLRRQKDSDIWQKIQTMVGADMIGCLLPGTEEFPNRGGMTYYYTVASYDPASRLYGDCSREGLSVTIEAPDNASDSMLREAARAIIAQITTEDMSQSAKLAACWNYCMCKDFIPNAYPDESQEGWKYQCAYDLLTGSGGNCYGYAHGFAALARELGYTPYVVVIPMCHCFVLIDGGFWDNMGNKMGAAAPTFSYTADQISLF